MDKAKPFRFLSSLFRAVPPVHKPSAEELQSLLTRMSAHYELRAQAQTLARVAALAKQVAHDIRSPLSALNFALSTMREIPEDKATLMRLAVKRISDVASELVADNPNAKAPSAELKNVFANLVAGTTAQLVVVDDDPSIHALWDQIGIEQLLHFHSPEELMLWLPTAEHPENLRFAIDFDFCNSEWNGLELIKKLRIAANAVLVTNRFEDREVIAHCALLGVRLMPKMFLGEVS